MSNGTKRSYRAVEISVYIIRDVWRSLTRHYHDLLLDQHRSLMLKLRDTNESVIAVLFHFFFFSAKCWCLLFFSIRLVVCSPQKPSFMEMKIFHFESKLKLILHGWSRDKFNELWLLGKARRSTSLLGERESRMGSRMARCPREQTW